MRRAAYLVLVMGLDACVPVTTGIGEAESQDADEHETGGSDSESGAQDHEASEGDADSSGTDSGEAADDGGGEADQDYADSIGAIASGTYGSSTYIMRVFAKNHTTLATFIFYVEQDDFDSMLLLSAEFPDMRAKWLFDKGEVSSTVSPEQGLIISARAEAIGGAILGHNKIAACGVALMDTLVACAAYQPACTAAFVQSYCECRHMLDEIAELVC